MVNSSFDVLTSKQNWPLAARILKQKTGGFFGSRYFSFCNHHHVAVSTFYADDFGCPYTVATAGANILDAVAVGVVPCRLVGVVTRTFAAWDVSAFDAVHIDIFPPLFQNELAQCVSRLGDAPSDTRVIADFKVAGLGSFLELFIVVLTAAAAILYAVLEVPKMYTLMQGGCHHVFYWPCKRPSTDVKLVAGRVTALPCLGYSNVSVGPGCALYRDDRFLQLAVEIFRIQCAEDFFKVSSGPGCFDGFFHFCVLTFVFPIFAHVIPSG